MSKLEQLSVQKLLIMMISAAFGFSLLLFNIGTGAIDQQNEDINEIHDNIKEIDRDLTTVKGDVAYIKGKLDNYWPDVKILNESSK
jgi:peptidoglycan hydrolase CwlO-like protein